MTDDTPRDPLAARHCIACGWTGNVGAKAHIAFIHPDEPRLAVLEQFGEEFVVRLPEPNLDATRPSGDEALRAFIDAWTPQHAYFCADQPEDNECVCGVGPEYERMLAATPSSTPDVPRIRDVKAEPVRVTAVFDEPSSTPDVEGLEALQRGIQAGVRRRLLAGAIGRIYTPAEVATMVGLAVDEQMERLAALATPSSTPDVEGVEMGLDVERLARALRFQFSRECLPDRDADFRAACIADDYAAARENKPPTTDEIAAQEGLKPESLRQALRESHPDASPSEVIGRAHDIEENT